MMTGNFTNHCEPSPLIACYSIFDADFAVFGVWQFLGGPGHHAIETRVAVRLGGVHLRRPVSDHVRRPGEQGRSRRGGDGIMLLLLLAIVIGIRIGGEEGRMILLIWRLITGAIPMLMPIPVMALRSR